MRVLVITKDFPAPEQPEDGIVVLRQASTLTGLGHEVLVARVAPYAPPLTRKWRGYRAIPNRYVIEGIAAATLRAVFPPRMIAMEYLPLQVGRALKRLADEFGADVVHAHCLIPSGQLAAHLDVPAVVTAHGSDAYDWAWRRPGLTRAASEGIRNADAVVAVSEYIRERVRALVDRPVEVIHNGADENVFFPADRAAARRMLGIGPERFVVAFAGGPPKIKGAFDLISAASILGDVRPLLLLAGPNSDRPSLLASSAAAGIDSRFCGMLDHPQLADVLAAADVFCLPSYREGLPLVICEAMLSGRPIVTTPVGGIPEIVSDGRHGFLVPPGNPGEIAKRLRALAGDPALGHRMGLVAHEFASRHLTWRINALRYDEIYRRICRLQCVETLTSSPL